MTDLAQHLDVSALAASLTEAARTATPIPQLSSRHHLGVDDGYAVQAALVRGRLEQGACPTGIKLGFTSQAKMAQMGVHEVILGRLTDDMSVPDGGSIDVGRFIHPRVEPEIAFRLSRDIESGEPAGVVMAAVDAVAPALEVIDSRYRDFRFNLADVVADNASGAAYVVGPWSSVHGRDLSVRGVLLEVDGRVVETGSTAAILGHPARALPHAVALARRLHIDLRAGHVILAGAATAAVALQAGAVVRARVAGLGSAVLVASGGGR